MSQAPCLIEPIAVPFVVLAGALLQCLALGLYGCLAAAAYVSELLLLLAASRAAPLWSSRRGMRCV